MVLENRDSRRPRSLVVGSSAVGILCGAHSPQLPPPSPPPALSLFLFLYLVAPRLKPRKPGNDQLNETSSALMHSPLWLVACLCLPACLPALPTGYTTRGITLKLHSSYRCVHFPPPTLYSGRGSVYLQLDNNRAAASDATIRYERRREKEREYTLSRNPRSLSNSNFSELGRRDIARLRPEVYLAKSSRHVDDRPATEESDGYEGCSHTHTSDF